MADEPQGTHRRRRRRATSEQGAPAPRQTTTPGPEAERGPEAAPGPERAPGPEAAPRSVPRAEEAAQRPRKQRPARDPGERGLRDLVGAGHSQLGVSGALRGRDANRPSDADLAEAEEQLVIVRRHWTPDKQPGK